MVVGTRGGPNRAEILSLLERRPYNAHELSRLLGRDYKTTRHHLDVLSKNGLVTVTKGVHGTLYEWSPAMRAMRTDWEQVWAAVRPRPRGAGAATSVPRVDGNPS
jgi:predicted transcriptional regulator